MFAPGAKLGPFKLVDIRACHAYELLDDVCLMGLQGVEVQDRSGIFFLRRPDGTSLSLSTKIQEQMEENPGHANPSLVLRFGPVHDILLLLSTRPKPKPDRLIQVGRTLEHEC